MIIGLGQLREKGLPVKLGLLTAAEIMALAVAAPIASLIGGMPGLLAATVAMFACLAGGAAALSVCSLLRDPALALAGVLLGMLFGMGLPLVVAVVCQASGGALARAGIMIYFLYFFPVTLTVKTVLSLPNVPSRVPFEKGQAG